jgi:osmotically-inducible protein OsmY
MHKQLLPWTLLLLAACAYDDDYEGSEPGQDTVGQGSSITEGLEQSDAEHAATIRQALFDADDLSTAAKNVTVLVESGAVTLSGVVPTVAERERVGEIAMASTGTTTVDNQITVEPR